MSETYPSAGRPPSPESMGASMGTGEQPTSSAAGSGGVSPQTSREPAAAEGGSVGTSMVPPPATAPSERPASSPSERVRKLPPPNPGPPRRGGPQRSLTQRGGPSSVRATEDKEEVTPSSLTAGREGRVGNVPPVPSPNPAAGPRAALNRRELDALIEAEWQAAIAGLDWDKSLASASEPPTSSTPAAAPGMAASLKRGQTVTGRIAAVHGRDVFVDIPGERNPGVVPLEQFEGQTPRAGETVLCRLESYDAANGLWQLSRQGAAQQVTDWSQLQPHMVVEARVTGVNKQRTGLLVEVAGVRGFLPASQIDLQRVEDLDAWVQQRLKVEIIEINPAERNLVVSRRAVLERERQQQAEAFWNQVEEGQVRRGVVRSVRPFGAFVDLGGVDGLLPASELAWGRVDNIQEVIQPGQEVEVVITKVDRLQRKLTLSLKRLTADPWAEFAAQTRPGTVVSGTITRLTEFGAFVQVAPGIEGLIHISELAPHRVRRVSEVVQPGQQVMVEVLSIDAEQRRLSLSMRTISQREQQAAAAAQAEQERLELQQALERLTQRKPSRPGLRGGIGSEPLPPTE